MYQSTFKEPVDNPNNTWVSAICVFEKQINPSGLSLKNFLFETTLNYKSYMHTSFGCFCVAKIQTLYSAN